MVRETVLGFVVGLSMGIALIHHASPDFFSETHRDYLYETLLAD